MTDKQLEFNFMKNNISEIISLSYIGGQDEDLGGYCEPLIIRYFDGMEQYVLHEMAQSRETIKIEYGNPAFGEIIDNHKKAIFFSKLELLSARDFVRGHLTINEKLSWQKTNNVCDCDCTPEEFYRIQRKDLEGEAA